MNYLPLYTVRKGDETSLITIEEELGLILYSAVSGRAKSLVYRKEERVISVTYIYYPLILVDFKGESTLIFDPLSTELIKFNYITLDTDHLDKLADETGSIKGRGFLEKLQEVSNVLSYIKDRKAFYQDVSIEIKGLIVNEDLLNELGSYVQLLTTKRDFAYEIETPLNSYREYGKLLEETLVKISRFKQYLNTFLSRIKRHQGEWSGHVKEMYGDLLKNIDEEIEQTKIEVGEKIKEYEAKRFDEESRVKVVYEPKLKEIDGKIAELESERRNLELELLKAKRIGGDVKSIKNEIKDVEKKIKQHVKLRNDISKSMDKEIEEIRVKFNELVEAERRRLIILERKKESVNRELEELLSLADDRLKDIEKKVNELVENYSNVEKNILLKTITHKVKDQEVFYIPMCIVIYEKEGKLREDLITPSYVSQGFLRKSFEKLDKLNSFLEDRLKELYMRFNLNKIIEENNILKRISIERVELALNSLKSRGILSGKDAELTLNYLGKR